MQRAAWSRVALVGQRDDELAVVADAVRGRLIAPVAPVDLEEAGNLAHALILRRRVRAAAVLSAAAPLELLERAAVLDRHDLAELRPVVGPVVQDLLRRASSP